MRFRTLDEWLEWQERLHPSVIDLGLNRCTEVARRMGLQRPSCPVITVAGTNGKGSCVMLLEACLRAAGYSTGAYTSPHLHNYRERIRIDGLEVRDPMLVESFARIDTARESVSLTFFEFGTLAALDIFCRAGVDVMVLEVGLGGRLDAVNVVDADYALIASVGVDHVEWLGDSRESVGFEKAGVLRAGQPCVYAERDVPASVLAHARDIGADLHRLGVDYGYQTGPSGWRWWSGGGNALDALPNPSLCGARQHQNAAAVLMLAELMAERLVIDERALRAGLVSAVLPGRAETLGVPVRCIVDVAHNPQAAAALAEHLAASPQVGRTLACIGMLDDKDVAGCVQAMRQVVDRWFAAGLDGPRGQTGETLAARIRAALGNAEVSAHGDVAQAYAATLAAAMPNDRVVVFGSLHTVAMVRALETSRS